MRGAALALCLTAGACGPAPVSVDTFAADPDRARRVVAECDAGATRDCEAARRGLAEARRRARMEGYAQTIRDRP